ncbi:MAG: nuclear transport factor 2 family protein [Saprospiraceae bacterium]|nr:nuclear transport factor 2 family protein [Saprospiraceae bacterium]MBK9726546.1 nuclear transport factor 2 family protein [Saprospiraceae bacterium]
MVKVQSIFTMLFLATTLLSFTSCDKEDTTPTLTNEQKVKELFTVFSTGNPDGLKHISDAQYKQHNPFAPDGKAGLTAMFNGQATGITLDNHRIFSEGNYVITHTTYGGTWNNGTPQVAFDVFRFDNGLIVEHWDNLQNISNPITDTTNGNSQTNGTTTISSGDVSANKTLVTNMVNNVLIAGQWSTRANYFATNYIQHSPNVPNGIAWMAMFPDGTPFYSSLKFVYGAGNFVLAMSEGLEFVNNTPTGNKKAYFDLFRIENGKIAEHWDAVSVIPPANQWANSNGKW